MSDKAFITKPADRAEIGRGKGSAPRIILRGDIDFRRAQGIREAILRVIEERHERVDVQLSGVVFVDSSGISALVDSAKAAGEKGTGLVLVSPSRQLIHLLEISGFKPLFEFEELPKPAPPREREPAPFYWQVTNFVVPCDPELVADIRHRVAQIAGSLPFTSEEVEDIKLAVGEACANAFQYGCPRGRSDTVAVPCVGDRESLTVEIEDLGPGLDPTAIPQPAPGSLQPGGRGIFFMRLTMDEVSFFRKESGTLVRMVKYINQASEESR